MRKHIDTQAALELAHYNISVNAIAPGAFATNIGGGRLKMESASERMRARIPLGRVAYPEDIKGLALFHSEVRGEEPVVEVGS